MRETRNVSKASDLLLLATNAAELAASELRRWSPHHRFAIEELSEIIDRLNGAAGSAEELMREIDRPAWKASMLPAASTEDTP